VHDDPYVPFGFSSSQPIVVVGNQLAWEQACLAWLHAMMQLDEAELERFPFLVRQFKGGDVVLPLADVAALYVADTGVEPAHIFGQAQWEAFQSAQKPIFARGKEKAVPGWATMAVTHPRGIPWDRFRSPAGGSAVLTELQQKRERHGIRVQADVDGLIYFKTAYYRGWTVHVDGQPVPNMDVSPGYNACAVDAGDHRVAFVYGGLNNGWLGAGISLGALMALGMAALAPTLRRWAERRLGAGP